MADRFLQVALLEAGGISSLLLKGDLGGHRSVQYSLSLAWPGSTSSYTFKDSSSGFRCAVGNLEEEGERD